jgi:hypothetical protein
MPFAVIIGENLEMIDNGVGYFRPIIMGLAIIVLIVDIPQYGLRVVF